MQVMKRFKYLIGTILTLQTAQTETKLVEGQAKESELFSSPVEESSVTKCQEGQL